MQPLAVDLRLLTDVGETALRLNPGRGLMARVMTADGHGRGVINLAGAVLEAELPANVKAGEQIRLVVRHVEDQRVVLELAHQPADAAGAAAVAQLPGGGQLRVNPDASDDPSGGGGRDAGAKTVALRYDAPALGPLDLSFEFAHGALRVHVAASPGEALSLARDQADSLRQALAQANSGPVSVTVSARRQPLDVYA